MHFLPIAQPNDIPESPHVPVLTSYLQEHWFLWFGPVLHVPVHLIRKVSLRLCKTLNLVLIFTVCRYDFFFHLVLQ